MTQIEAGFPTPVRCAWHGVRLFLCKKYLPRGVISWHTLMGVRREAQERTQCFMCCAGGAPSCVIMGQHIQKREPARPIEFTTLLPERKSGVDFGLYELTGGLVLSFRIWKNSGHHLAHFLGAPQFVDDRAISGCTLLPNRHSAKLWPEFAQMRGTQDQTSY